MKALCITIVLLCASIALAEPTTQPTSAIAGTVTNNGQPLAHVSVRLMQPNDPAGVATIDKNDKDGKKAARKAGHGKRVLVAETTTDENGKFAFNNLAAGQYVIVVRDAGSELGGMSQVTITDHQSATVSVAVQEKSQKKKSKGK